MIVNVKLSIPSANVYSEEYNNFFGTQVALMQSDTVKDHVHLRLQSSNPELHPTPVSIDVTLSAKTSIFNLQAVGANPDYVQAYLKATMDEYIRLKKDLLASATTATHSSMEEELGRLAGELQKSRADLLNYQSNNSVVFLQPSGGNSAADQLSSLTQRLAADKSELQLTKALTLDENLERLHDQLGRQGPASNTNSASGPPTTPANGSAGKDAPQNNLPVTLGESEEDYLKAKEQIVLLKNRMKELSYLHTNAFQIVELNDQLTRQENLLEIYKEQSQERLENRQHILALQIQDLESQVKEWEFKALDVSKKLSDYEMLKENHLRLQSQYDQMQANLQTIDLNKGIGQESVTILEPAGPALPSPPETVKHLIMAGLIGLFLGIGILVLIHQLDDRPSTFTELEHLFDLPVLGQIPLVKATDKKNGVPILQLEDERYPLIEAYRSLRSAFLYKDSLKQEAVSQPKTIVVASASPNDGKSMTAANIAITFAQAGARVLLIDADLRRGVLHNHFSVPMNPGLADVLAGQCDWRSAVVQTPVPNLHFLPCGTSPRHSHNVFAKAGKFIEEIAGQYDYYIFDTAPVIVADDVLSLAPHVDGLLMVIRAGFTSGRIARAALEMLHQRRVNVIGLVFNAVQPNAGDFYYYRSKEYYPQNPPA
ncbi:MAG: polysaccharide biosynthesis tyrosine autokinase [Verrucomicrobiae bacterium]|nr:polysaccharide biosynthesis tyrosine autokinase [Verrucomicrobiae bacterium]